MSFQTKLFLKKIALIGFGCILAFILLESLLQVGGIGFIVAQRYHNAKALKQKGNYKILCVGDSTTALGGKNSYPQLLEKSLNQNTLNKRFTVINKGMPASDSTFILNNLDSYIQKFRPHMVILMTGINDSVVAPSRQIIQKRHPLKTVQLLTFLTKHFIVKTHSKNNPDEMDSFYAGWRFASEQVKEGEIINNFTKENLPWALDHAYLGMGVWFYAQDKYPQAKQCFHESLKHNPLNIGGYIALSDLYIKQKRWDKAIHILQQGSKHQPESIDISMYLAWCYFNTDKKSESKKIYEDIFNAHPRFETSMALKLFHTVDIKNKPHQYFTEFPFHNPQAPTRDNYLQIHAILKKYNIQSVFMQYPRMSINPIKNLFPRETDIVYIDNENNFNIAIQKSSFNDFFYNNFAGFFGHCTRKGNQLIADNLKTLILEKIHKSYEK